MPSFLKDLRRRSTKVSVNSTDRSSSANSSSPYTSASGNSNNSGSKSSSTLSSLFNLPAGARTDHSPDKHLQSNGRPPPTATARSSSTRNNRYSMNGSLPTTNGTSSRTGPSSLSSPLAPRVLSVSDNSWVNQRVLLIYGQVGDPDTQHVDGTLSVCHHHDTFPTMSWPVCDSHFKALVQLQPGPNRIKLDFVRARSSNPNTSPHVSHININYLPLNCSPPLQLAIVLAKDSPGTFDAVPERIQREGNNLDIAVRKFRMAATLWQAFTGEQMNRNGFGRRCFRLEEEWQQATLSHRDLEAGQMRNEVKVHIIRSDKTVREIRDLEAARRYDSARGGDYLYNIAMDAIKSYFSVQTGQTRYVACMFLDTQWDSEAKVVRGHAAMGGGDGTVQLATFGSHALQSYPTYTEDVVPAFSDCTRTDTKFVADHLEKSGSNWEAVNVGVGAHLREVGRLFGCPDQQSGIMSGDYLSLNRTFTCREPYSTRTKAPGRRLCLPADECTWHRLDCLRFRFHPCFRLPTDPSPNLDDSVQVWAVDNGNVFATAPTGIAFTELFADGDALCRSHIEHATENGTTPPRQVCLTEADLHARLPESQRSKRLRLVVHSVGRRTHVIEDFSALASKASRVRLPNGQLGFRGSRLGRSDTDSATTPEDLILDSAVIQTKLLTQIRVYHGAAVHALEFVHEDATSQLFGNRDADAGCTEFNLDTRRGEILMGFHVRAGERVDGIQILTSLGRRSEVFGNPVGGAGHTLIPPRGYSIAGVSGSCAQWLDSFSLIITR